MSADRAPAAFLACGLVLSLGAEASRAQSRPFPAHAEYAPGTLLPSHRTQAQLDGDVRAAYDSWKSRYVRQAGTEADGHPRYRVVRGSTAQDPTVSEGQGYGLVIVALMAGHDAQARTVFDGLWEFSRDHPSTIDSRLFDWFQNADESPDPNGDDSAFDGDCDIAYGLLLADRQWGSAGRINYRARALEVLAGMLTREVGPLSQRPMLGDWCPINELMFNQWCGRTSDFMTGHFRAFARATGQSRWNTVATSSLGVAATLRTGHAPVTGLLPDFFERISPGNPTPRPASAGFLEGAHDGHYYYNAGRDPWRFAADAALSGDAGASGAALAITNWARSSAGANPMLIRPGYLLDGTPIQTDYFTTFFAAPIGAAAMLGPAQANQAWLNGVYDAVRSRVEGYYEDSVTLQCLLLMTGNWWDPTLPLCRADVDSDGAVGLSDVAAAISSWGATVIPGSGADASQNGVVDLADVAAVIDGWGGCG